MNSSVCPILQKDFQRLQRQIQMPQPIPAEPGQLVITATAFRAGHEAIAAIPKYLQDTECIAAPLHEVATQNIGWRIATNLKIKK